MSKHSIDYKNLFDTMYNKTYKLTDVKHRIEKVAFDVVRFKDGDERANLWQVQSADDGEEYIIAMYKDDEGLEVRASYCPWEVSISDLGSDLNVYYKGEQIAKVASSKLGVPTAELQDVVHYLPSKLANNTKLVKALLNELNDSAKDKVINKYPELVDTK